MNHLLREKAPITEAGWEELDTEAKERLEITTACPSCGEPLTYSASHTEPPDADAHTVVRLPRPAAEWWDDVVATCTNIRAFCSRAHVDDWRAATDAPEGYVTDLRTLWQLALPWYGDRLDPNWQPHSREHNQARDCI